MTVRIIEGDCLASMREMPDESVQCCVTSPPYFGLRDYGTGKWSGGDTVGCDHQNGALASNKSTLAGYTSENVKIRTNGMPFATKCGKCGATREDHQFGLESTPELYVSKMVEVFHEVRRVLRNDGTLWLNIGDSYAGGGRGGNPADSAFRKQATNVGSLVAASPIPVGCKPKDLIGIPWMLAFALRADGWYLRSEIIWAKPNPMPESVTDRPTKSHEQIFLLAKSQRYFYDSEAIAEDSVYPEGSRENVPQGIFGGKNTGQSQTAFRAIRNTRNRRSVWTIATQPYSGAHFATFPPKLIEPCILAGTSPQACEICGSPWERVVEGPKYEPAEGIRFVDESRGDKTRKLSGPAFNAIAAQRRTTGWQPTCDCENTGGARCVVLDPFGGAGTTAVVADRLGRDAILCELNPEYAEIARRRVFDDAPLFAEVGA